MKRSRVKSSFKAIVMVIYFALASLSLLIALMYNACSLDGVKISKLGMICNLVALAILSVFTALYILLAKGASTPRSVFVDTGDPIVRFIMKAQPVFQLIGLLIPLPIMIGVGLFASNLVIQSPSTLSPISRCQAQAALAIENTLFGDPLTLDLARKCAWHHIDRKDWSKAEPYLKYRVDHFGECKYHSSSEVSFALEDLGRAYELQGKFTDAEACYRELLTRHLGQKDNETPWFLKTRAQYVATIAAICDRQGRDIEADSLFNAAEQDFLRYENLIHGQGKHQNYRPYCFGRWQKALRAAPESALSDLVDMDYVTAKQKPTSVDFGREIVMVPTEAYDRLKAFESLPISSEDSFAGRNQSRVRDLRSAGCTGSSFALLRSEIVAHLSNFAPRDLSARLSALKEEMDRCEPKTTADFLMPKFFFIDKDTHDELISLSGANARKEYQKFVYETSYPFRAFAGLPAGSVH